MSLVDFLTGLADRWDFCLSCAVAGLALGRTALAAPLLGFLCRKVLLFVPVCGAVSTADQVLFWSGGAFLYHLLLTAFILLAVVPALFLARRLIQEPDMGGPLLFLAGVAYGLPAVGAYFLLPAGGWSLLYMP